MVVTLKDIADAVGVKKQTVSVVLNNKPTAIPVSKATRERILETARHMKYHPNGAARSLATGRTQRVAFWMPVLEGRFFHEISCLLHRLVRDKRYELIAWEFDRQTPDHSHSAGFARIDVDGVMVFGSGLEPKVHSNLGRVPIVNMGMHCSGGPQDFVEVDLYPASRKAVEYLLDRGRSRVAYMLCVEDDRHQAYLDAMRNADKSPELIVCPDYFRGTGRRVLKEYVLAHGCPEGIFCISDELAIGASRGLRDLGLRIPRDVTMVGCEGIEDLDYLESPISSVSVPKDEMCRLAWDFLYQRIQQPQVPQQAAFLSATLQVRE